MPHPASPSIDPEGLAAQLAAASAAHPAPLLVDVREAHELAAGTIASARHLPLGEVEARADELPRDQPMVIYCQHGVRSARAIAILRQLGFHQLTNLAGGYSAWAAQEAPAGGAASPPSAGR